MRGLPHRARILRDDHLRLAEAGLGHGLPDARNHHALHLLAVLAQELGLPALVDGLLAQRLFFVSAGVVGALAQVERRCDLGRCGGAGDVAVVDDEGGGWVAGVSLLSRMGAGIG